MIYTQARRRALNKALRNMYPEVDFFESANGIPVMKCSTLPKGVKHINNTDDFIRQVKEHCTHRNEMGTTITDYNKTLPVFIESMELDKNKVQHFYRVNYVSANECSLQKAADYISEGKLYAVPT